MQQRTCTIDGCDKPYRARGLCASHWNAAYRKDQHREVPCAVCGTMVVKNAMPWWLAVIAGIAVYSAPLLANLSLSGMEDEVFDPALLGQWKQGGKVKFRSDGLAKVTGQKIYSRD